MPGNKVAIVLGNRETMINATLKAVLGQAYKEIDFHFESATRAGDFIELATRPETRLALFIPPGNIDPEPGISKATVEDEIVRIITTIKAKNPIPLIVLAVQSHAREMALASGANFFFDIPTPALDIADAVAKCLGLEPGKTVAP